MKNERFYLDCPFNEKDMCKHIGGRWDMDTKQWYVPSDLNPDEFRRWWPDKAEDAHEPSLHIVGNN